MEPPVTIFVTICHIIGCHGLGRSDCGSDLRQLEDRCKNLESIPAHHPKVGLDAWVIMPNHIHAIVLFKN